MLAEPGVSCKILHGSNEISGQKRGGDLGRVFRFDFTASWCSQICREWFHSFATIVRDTYCVIKVYQYRRFLNRCHNTLIC